MVIITSREMNLILVRIRSKNPASAESPYELMASLTVIREALKIGTMATIKGANKAIALCMIIPV